MDDVKLLKRLKEKKRGALETAMEMYTGYVTVIVYGYIGRIMSKEDVEEVVADSFVSLWMYAENLDESKNSIKPYLATIARNTAKNKLRKANTNLNIDDIENLIADKTVEEEAENQEMSQIINNLVNGLGEPDREIFLRYYYQGEKLNTIADKLDIKTSTAKTKLFRSRNRLKKYLTEMGWHYEA